jgi:hypothetical protein
LLSWDRGLVSAFLQVEEAGAGNCWVWVCLHVTCHCRRRALAAAHLSRAHIYTTTLPLPEPCSAHCSLHHPARTPVSCDSSGEHVLQGEIGMGRGRAPCCAKVGLNRGSWTPQEDMRLMAYIQKHGHANWRALPKQAGRYTASASASASAS